MEESVGFLGVGVGQKTGDGGKQSGGFTVLEEKRGDEGEGVSSQRCGERERGELEGREGMGWVC